MQVHRPLSPRDYVENGLEPGVFREGRVEGKAPAKFRAAGGQTQGKHPSTKQEEEAKTTRGEEGGHPRQENDKLGVVVHARRLTTAVSTLVFRPPCWPRPSSHDGCAALGLLFAWLWLG